MEHTVVDVFADPFHLSLHGAEFSRPFPRQWSHLGAAISAGPHMSGHWQQPHLPNTQESTYITQADLKTTV